ncbi:AAA family ATPase [Ferrimonas balearica]|uniref:AAA family ATPase n=1 Tax=Ferrimonas balearica TaxID=44012 RepID=UPI001C55EC11|nr:AAA family ATPase [Ferrimonas balearica]MBW3164596.1 AAA family ATPase [Ferrimonas balearica]
MKIKQLNLTNFRRFEDFSIDFEENVTVLVARNGAGKSSVLDGIALCLGSFLTRLPKAKGIAFKNSDFRVFPDGTQPPYMRLKATSYDGVSWDRSESRDKSKKTLSQIPSALGQSQLFEYADSITDNYNDGNEFELPVLAYYGTGRGVFDIPGRTKGFGKDFSRFHAFEGCLNSRTNFRGLVAYFYHLEEREHKLQKEQRSFDIELPELKAIRLAISKLMPGFSNPRGVYPAGIMVDWKQEGSSETKRLRIEQLSDGYRTTIAMVMDIAARMGEANPTAPEPLSTSGIILIDEVDLHLHPGWQQHFISDLTRTFPEVQFVLSTHSPQIVSSVKPNQLRVIDWEGEKPRLIPVHFSEGAEAHHVLQSVLGLESLRPKHLSVVKELDEYKLLVKNNKWDTPRALELRRTLDEWGAEHEPDLARLDMDIRLKELDR